MMLLARHWFYSLAILLPLLMPASLMAQSAELFLQSLDAPPGPFEQGDTLIISSTTNNIGDVASGVYTITFFLSEDFGVSEDDTPIGSQERPSLGSASVDQTPVNATIPANMPPGQYYINGLIDYEDEIPQNNENFDAGLVEVVASGASAFVINTAISDAWFNPATDGQGFFIIVWESSELIFLSWFTYDTERPPQDVTAYFGEPGHRWLTAQGGFSGDTAMLDVYLSSGGVLDSPSPAPEPAMLVGTMKIVWSNCNEGVLSYELPALNLSGEIPIQRIVLDNIAACEEAQSD